MTLIADLFVTVSIANSDTVQLIKMAAFIKTATYFSSYPLYSLTSFGSNAVISFFTFSNISLFTISIVK